MAAITNKRTKRLLLLALVALIAIGYGLNARFSHHSTVYKGKTIDQWLEQTTRMDAGNAAFDNLKEAGEIAVPDLVRAMTSRQSFLYRHVKPRLPTMLRKLVPRDKRGARQYNAYVVLNLMPLRAEQIIRAVRPRLRNCDENGLQLATRALLTATQRSDSDTGEVVKIIPDLRLACSRIHDTNGVSSDYIWRLNGLVQASAQLRDWFRPGASGDDVRRLLQTHNFSYVGKTNDSIGGGGPSLFLDCFPRGMYNPSGTNPIIGIHLMLWMTNNNVSSVAVGYPGLFQ